MLRAALSNLSNLFRALVSVHTPGCTDDGCVRRRRLDGRTRRELQLAKVN